MLDDLRKRLENEVNKVGISKIAATLGISRGTVYNWIANGNVPLDKLVALRELGLDVQYITGGVRTESSLTQDERELMALFRKASEAEKKAAIGALRGMIGSGVTISATNGGQAAGRDINYNTPPERKK